MADGTSTATVSFGKCPACQLSITATIAYATTLGSNSFSNEVVTATLKPVGVYLQHECKDGRVVPVARRRTPGCWRSATSARPTACTARSTCS